MLEFSLPPIVIKETDLDPIVINPRNVDFSNPQRNNKSAVLSKKRQKSKIYHRTRNK